MLVRRRLVREAGSGVWYEDEGSARVSRGAVTVAAGAWWSVMLAVAQRDGMPDARLAQLHLERHGAEAAGGAPNALVDVLLAGEELDALVLLLAGAVAQARRDAVLPPGG